MRLLVLLFVTTILAFGCGTAPVAVDSSPRLFEGMGAHHRAVNTASPEARRFFDQGLNFTFSFNHDEAIRSFTEAARLDPQCAMAWWGVALCNGPHINNPAMDAAHSAAAWEALGKAQALRAGAAPADQALIEALGARYAAEPPADRAALDRAYADAMRKAYQQYPDDNDIHVLAAESLMDLRPWDLWSLDGIPRPETPEIQSLLEEVLAADPNHPGACHLYIHTMEASRSVAKATAAADRLCTLVPAAGHMVHMPAHIYARTGRWADANRQNEAAITADAAYRELSPGQGFYRIYMAHNHHFLAFGCMMTGESKKALEAADAMIAGIPQEFIDGATALIDPYLAIRIEVLMRFGRWSDILAEPQPAAKLHTTTALWHFARGVAHSAKGELDAARKEEQAFDAAVELVAKDAKVGNSPAHDVLKVAKEMLAGEIDYRAGRLDEALVHLRAAVRTEDTLHYNEPPDWIQPSRHTLGALLLEAGRVNEAATVYREDLRRWPDNGWSLFGLWKCLAAQHSPDANAARAKFETAWEKADTRIGATCLCVK